MTNEQYKAMLANASAGTRKLNADNPHGGAGSVAILERCSRPEPLAAHQTQKTDRDRFYVSIISYRRRLLDEDNLCEKFHCDLCRYAGIIPADSPAVAKIEVGQIQVGRSEPERTRIEVWKLQ